MFIGIESDDFGLPDETTSSSTYHTYPDPADVMLLRSQLLNWYDKDKRELPWRTLVRRNASFVGFKTFSSVQTHIQLKYKHTCPCENIQPVSPKRCVIFAAEWGSNCLLFRSGS